MSLRLQTIKPSTLILSFLILLPSIVSAAQNRVALVIGNSDYEHFTTLNNPENDAHDIAERLEDIGFDVIKVLNASREDMNEAVYKFSNKLSPGSMSVIFYAGHGIQSKGENYLIPTSAKIEKEYQLLDRAVSVSGLLASLDSNTGGSNIVILDACRDNPLAGTTRSMGRGLARIKQRPANSLILYATGEGDTAADGEGRNGLFTKHLLRSMANSSYSLSAMVDATLEGVSKASAYKQIPATYSSLAGTQLSLHPGWSPSSGSFSQDPDTEFYLSIKGSNDKTDFEDYLKAFPNGKWANDALAKIDEFSSHYDTPSKPTFVFTMPEGSKLIFKGQSEEGFSPNETNLLLDEGSNTFTLKMKNGRKIYGDLQVTHIDDKVLGTMFGLDEKEGPLPKAKHIKAAMRGSPVQYRITMNTNSGVRQVLNYRLSLRPIRK